MRLKGRVEKLEQVRPHAALSQSARRWLGITLTPAENAQADREETEALPFDPVAVANDPNLSAEVKAWLLQA
ncbi:hypothetical protein GCM10023208_08290 [Erythrobacter westpacificensis]|uniref:Uncharacterized protein n=1 Tax=Erythrobacter westpacificensis TaxID=1055231 RepID=A0ABP9K307_9SPHN